MILTIDLHLAPRLRISGAVLLLPLYAFIVLTWIFPFISVSNYQDFIPVVMTYLLRTENPALFFFRLIHEKLTVSANDSCFHVSTLCLQCAV